MKNNKEQVPALEKPNTNLEFKDHSEFFEMYFRIKNIFQVEFAKGYYDKEALKMCFQNLQALIMLTTAQLARVTELEEIKKKETEILNLLKSRNNDITINKIRELHDELSILWASVDIIPNVREEILNDSLSFWKDENNAGFREMKKAFYDSFMLPTD